MESTEVARWLLWLSISFVYIKAVLGFHFPWEICQCCGKTYGEHTHES